MELKFYFDNHNKIIAATTYRGKTIKGVAKCHPADNFDLETGKSLAAQRCLKKYYEKKAERAIALWQKATARARQAIKKREELRKYATLVSKDLAAVSEELAKFEEGL